MAVAASLLLSLISLVICFSCIAYGVEFPLQDFCVADPTSSVKVNGLVCKNPTQVKPDDFFFSGLHIPGNTSNPSGLAGKFANVAQIPGLNTLAVSLIRFDFAPKGIISPHVHHRASEILVVLEGSLKVGFITSAPSYTHFSKVLNKGDVFVFPVGLVHYLFNLSPGNAVAMAAFNSENPGLIAVTNAVFGAKPDIDAGFLSKAFQIEKPVVDRLLATF